MAVAGNTVPIYLDETQPVGSSIKVRQLDDYQREARAALKTFLERSHVAFGNAKAGEMLAGTAAPKVDTNAALAALTAADWEGRLAIAHDRNELYSWRDFGSGIVKHRVASILRTSDKSYAVETSLSLQNLTASTWTDVGAPITAQLSGWTDAEYRGVVDWFVFYSVPVRNNNGSNSRGFAARATADTGSGFNYAFFFQTYQSARVRQGDGVSLFGVACKFGITIGSSPTYPKLDARVEVFCDGTDGQVCGDSVSGESEKATIISVLLKP